MTGGCSVQLFGRIEALMSRSSAIWRCLNVAPRFLAASLCAVGGFGQTITEFPVPTPVGRPQGIASGPDGAVWFTEEPGNKIGRITSSGIIDEFPIPTAGAWPYGITAGPDGNLWFTERLVQGNVGQGKIGRITPAGAITEFPIPALESVPEGITAGPDGNLWFVDEEANNVGRITTSGAITEFPVPTQASTGPVGITAGPDGNLWFTEGAGNKIGRITPSGTITEFSIPAADSYPLSITAGPDGNLWFTESSGGKIGRITTDGVVTEFLGGLYIPKGITVGPDNNLWFLEYGSNRVWRLTTDGVGTPMAIPTSSSYPMQIASGPDGALWFTENGANQIGRLSVESTPCVADTTTLCLNNGRFRVAAVWRKSDGSTGQGTGVPLTPDSGYFWFFNSGNIELVVKVLSACSLNPSRYWVFAAGLTNVEVTITVTDTHSGSVKTYTNALGTAFAPIQDTSAFATCP